MSSKQHLKFSLIALTIILSLRFLLIPLSVDDLRFILQPVSVIVSWISNITFEWLPEQGYFNENSQILINKSCSGAFFLILVFGFSSAYFLIKENKKIRLLYLLPLFFILAYLLTIFVNAQRISLFIWIYRNQNLLPSILQEDYIHQFFGGIYYALSLVITLYLIIKPKQL